jgi:hypothetical protein
LSHYVTSQKVAGSIPNAVTRFFDLPNPSSLTMALGLTQLLKEMSTRNLPGGKGQPSAHKADNPTAAFYVVYFLLFFSQLRFSQNFQKVEGWGVADAWFAPIYEALVSTTSGYKRTW